jgi:hypothetical protein
MRSFSERIIGAAKFDTQVYEEVEVDTSATGQAMGVVLLSSLAAGVGSVGLGFGGVLIACLASLIGWVVWAAITYFIGTRLLPEAQTRADIGQLMRTLGFAQAPGLARIVGVFPGVGQFVLGIVSIWMLATMIVAVRQALDYKSTLRAAGVVSVGWLFYLIVFMPFALMSMNP